MDVKFEEVFKTSLRSLKICRAHPDIPKNFKWFLPFLLVQGTYTINFCFLFYNVYYNMTINDFIQTCKNGTFCIMIISASFQYAILIWKKNFLSKLFDSVKNDYVNMKKLPGKEQEIIYKYAKQSIAVGKIWLLVAVLGVLIFPIKNVILHIYYYYIGDFKWIHLYDMKFPKFINDKKDHIVLFSVLYFNMIFFSAYGACVFCSFSPLGPNFMLHACGQLEILTKRIENLFYGKLSVQDIMTNLKSIAMELQRIYNFVDDIQETFRLGYEMILKVTAIILPISLYEIIEAFGDGDLPVEFLAFMIGSIIISTSPCYYSEKLMEKGEKFRLAIYSCGWERTWDRRARVMILLLLQRASRPIAINTIFRTLCLDTLTDVYRLSYTIFNLMNAMWE